MQRGAGRRKRGERERKRGERERRLHVMQTHHETSRKKVFLSFCSAPVQEKQQQKKKRKNNCWVPAVVLQSLTNILKVPSPPRLCLNCCFSKQSWSKNKKKKKDVRKQEKKSIFTTEHKLCVV